MGRVFRDDAEKWQFLEAAPFADARDMRIVGAARGLRVAARSDLVFAHLAHALARDGIRYKTDMARVGREDIQDAGAVWTAYVRGVDDCDAKARFFCALCLAGELQARMVPRWENGALIHVSAEVRLAGNWYPVELTVARARLGDLAENVPFEKGTGRWLRP